MRLKLYFDLSNKKVPMDYRPIFISYFKNIFKNYKNGILFNQYYHPSAYKPFSFAIKFDKPIFTKEHIIVDNQKFIMTWTSYDLEAAIEFYNALTLQKNELYPMPFGNYMNLKKIYIENEPLINSNEILINFISPLCVRKHESITNKDFYYSSSREGFSEALKDSLEKQIKEFFKEDILSGFRLVPINAKKTVVNHHGGIFEVSLGQFSMSGSSELLTYFYQSGIGSRRSAGFGCFDLILQKE